MTCRLILSFTVMIVLARAMLLVPTIHGDELDCLIEPYVVINLGSTVEGLLDTVTVDRGDLVKEGQVLATIESSVEKATVAVYSARATMEAAIKINQARLELSTRQLSRNEGLFQEALIAINKMDEVETTKHLAEQGLAEALENKRLAELELQRATADLARRTIRSPITGVVVKRFLSPGEFVSEAAPILKLAQIDPLHVEVFAPVSLLGKVVVDMQAKVMPQAPVNGVHMARVTVVDPVVDAASGTFGVRLKLPNRGYHLPAGLKCTVRFLQR